MAEWQQFANEFKLEVAHPWELGLRRNHLYKLYKRQNELEMLGQVAFPNKGGRASARNGERGQCVKESVSYCWLT